MFLVPRRVFFLIMEVYVPVQQPLHPRQAYVLCIASRVVVRLNKFMVSAQQEMSVVLLQLQVLLHLQPHPRHVLSLLLAQSAAVKLIGMQAAIAT